MQNNASQDSTPSKTNFHTLVIEMCNLPNSAITDRPLKLTADNGLSDMCPLYFSTPEEHVYFEMVHGYSVDTLDIHPLLENLLIENAERLKLISKTKWIPILFNESNFLKMDDSITFNL